MVLVIVIPRQFYLVLNNNITFFVDYCWDYAGILNYKANYR